MKHLLFFIFSFSNYIACTQPTVDAPDNTSKKTAYLYCKVNNQDSLMLLLKDRGERSFLIIKQKYGVQVDTIMEFSNVISIKDIKFYDNEKCIIIYKYAYAGSVDFLAAKRTNKWSFVCSGGLYGLPISFSYVNPSPPPADSKQRLDSLAAIMFPETESKIIDKNTIYASKDKKKGDNFYVHIDYENRDYYYIKKYEKPPFKFLVVKQNVSDNVALLSERMGKTDTIWRNHAIDTISSARIDTVLCDTDKVAFLTRAINPNDKLIWQYHCYQFDGNVWRLIICAFISYDEVMDHNHWSRIKFLDYNRIQVKKHNRKQFIIEYDLTTKTEKRTEIKE